MPGRKFNSGNYRHGFNGKENDRHWGDQLIQDYGFRLYNPAIGKFLSVDPLSSEYPYYTPYQFAGNKPIRFIDRDGLEEALPEQKEKAMQMINAFEINANSQQAFTKISKAALIQDLRNVVRNPAVISIPPNSGFFCGLYAYAFLSAYMNPEEYVQNVLNLYQTGKTNSNGHTIEASGNLKNANPASIHEVSAFILGAATRVNDNCCIPYADNSPKGWNNTIPGTMRVWLGDYLNLDIEEFSYDWEFVGDGVKGNDIQNLKDHIDKGYQVMTLSIAQKFDGKKKGGGFWGDHFVVLTGSLEYSEKNNSITFSYYDDHLEGSPIATKTMALSEFRQMVRWVAKVKSKGTSKENK